MITIERITELQKQYGLISAQNLVITGQIWGFEGSVGRTAMHLLEIGILMLGEEPTSDYYGNGIPARTMLKEGTKGTLGNSQKFWGMVDAGNFDAIDIVEEYQNFMSNSFSAIE